MSPWTLLKSSNIAACYYQRKRRRLWIAFHHGDRIYRYEKVSWSLYLRFRRAESKGRFFGSQIRPFPKKYPYLRVR